MKIYTKTGDDGSTGLLGAGRVAKDSARIEAYGTVDELNAVLGIARTQPIDADCDMILARIQQQLFAVGAALADPNPSGPFYSAITNEHVASLEHEIDAVEAQLPPLSQFILPGGASAAGQIHFARTVCRRAERRVARAMREPAESIAPEILVYLNRLSDLLFMLARLCNHRASVSDIPWAGL